MKLTLLLHLLIVVAHIGNGHVCIISSRFLPDGLVMRTPTDDLPHSFARSCKGGSLLSARARRNTLLLDQYFEEQNH